VTWEGDPEKGCGLMIVGALVLVTILVVVAYVLGYLGG
jgi:hypothetical protein